MTIWRNRMPKSADLQLLNNNYPVVQVRLRVRWNEVSEFLESIQHIFRAGGSPEHARCFVPA